MHHERPLAIDVLSQLLRGNLRQLKRANRQQPHLPSRCPLRWTSRPSHRRFRGRLLVVAVHVDFRYAPLIRIVTSLTRSAGESTVKGAKLLFGFTRTGVAETRKLSAHDTE